MRTDKIKGGQQKESAQQFTDLARQCKTQIIGYDLARQRHKTIHRETSRHADEVPNTVLS